MPGAHRKLWRAVLARDRQWDGSFVYAVRSTGIYCCPSCPSRRPHRKQVVFFPLPAAAEKAGFRPCKRCQPRALEALLEKGRLEKELRLATEIQQRLRPSTAPRMEGWEIVGLCSSCREIGGDYYDFFPQPDQSGLVIALGDVAGKGIDAALLMASLHAAVRAESQNGQSAGRVMGRINRYLCDNTPPERFATLFYARLQPAAGLLEYCNGGHWPPLLLRSSGEMLRLGRGGWPIGLVREAAYQEEMVAVEPGDVLVLYTDGVSEARGEADEEFGDLRLAAIVRESLERTAVELCKRIEMELAEFLGSAAPPDDRALVVLKRAPTESRLTQDSTRADQAIAEFLPVQGSAR